MCVSVCVCVLKGENPFECIYNYPSSALLRQTGRMPSKCAFFSLTMSTIKCHTMDSSYAWYSKWAQDTMRFDCTRFQRGSFLCQWRLARRLLLCWCCGRKKQIKLMNKKVLSNDYKWCLKCAPIKESGIMLRLWLSLLCFYIISSALVLFDTTSTADWRGNFLVEQHYELWTEIYLCIEWFNWISRALK